MNIARNRWNVAAIALLPLLAAGPATAGKLTVLYSFTGGADGATPYKGPTLDSSGALYGESFYGANACADSYQFSGVGCGTTYSFAKKVFKPLVTFTGADNGADGFSNVTVSGKTLYGGAYLGGASDAGLVFSVSTGGKGFATLHAFTGGDGAQPNSFVRVGSDGTLYSVAAYGGPGWTGSANSGFGLLFGIPPGGGYVAEHDFSGGTDGGNPGRIFLGSDDTVYGTTSVGGSCSGTGLPAAGCGVIYSFVPSTAQFTVLHTMDGNADGYQPTIGAMDAAGNLYGASFRGGANAYGTLWMLKKTGSGYSFKLLYSFAGGADGAYPIAPALDQDGSLVGNTVNGPVTQSSSGAGVLFRFANGKVKALYTFINDAHGGYPQGTPVIDGSGAIYGTTAYGGIQPCYVGNDSGNMLISSFGCGVLFKYLP